MYSNPHKTFKEAVLEAVHAIPKGKVVSYGQVAAAVGSPRAALQVGGVLKGISDIEKIPWWRVVNAAGEISIKGNFLVDKNDQVELLQAEGILINKNFKIENMERYRYYFKV